MVVARDISKSFKGVQALDALSFEVNEGEIYGFIGPDGAGKTTLFRILTSLMVPDQGKAMVAGFDVEKDYKNVRKITGYMPGRFSLYQDLTVWENLKFFASVFGTTVRQNYETIKDVYIQIEPFKNRLAGQLSGGMKQKLALSCALIHKPRLLVLDEPTTGVDAVSRREFWNLLNGLKEKGITIIVSTPYMDEADRCDRVSLIQKGKILKTDKPGNFAESYGKVLFGIKSGNNYAVLKDLENYSGCESVFAFGQTLHYTSKNREESVGRLENFLASRGHHQVKIEKIKPEIEDIFMQLMGKDKAAGAEIK